jgi:hypothetical protein
VIDTQLIISPLLKRTLLPCLSFIFANRRLIHTEFINVFVPDDASEPHRHDNRYYAIYGMPIQQQQLQHHPQAATDNLNMHLSKTLFKLQSCTCTWQGSLGVQVHSSSKYSSGQSRKWQLLFWK